MSFDADEEILQDFLVEAGEILEQLSEQLVDLENRIDDKDLLNAIFRGFHTVKGGAGFLQLEPLVELCHIAENVFDCLRNSKLSVTSELMDVVLQSLDNVNEMFSQVSQRIEPEPAPKELLAALQKFVDVASGKVPAATEAPASPPPAAEPPPAAPAPEPVAETPPPPAPKEEKKEPAPSAEAGEDEISEEEFAALLDELHGQDGAPKGAPSVAAQGQAAGGGEPNKLDEIISSDQEQISDDEFEILLDALHGKGQHSGTPGVPVSSGASDSQPAAEAAPAAPTKTAPTSIAAGDPDGVISDNEFEDLLDELHGKGKGPTAASTPSSAPAARVALKPAPTPVVESAPEKVVESAPAVTENTPLSSISDPKKVEEVASKRIAPKTQNKEGGSMAETTVRVDTKRLDDIMNMVGELVLVRNRLVRLGLKSADEAMAKAVANLDVVTADLQTSVMKTRMQPIKKVFGRFPRVVRDLARNLKKEINLELQGEDTDLDKNLVEALADPLVHLVRNSVDHGIEKPEVREELGKARSGKVVLAAQQEGDHIVLSITDDGGGMDPDVLRRKAVEKGLMDEESAERISDHEAFNLIFHPGFSTKNEISDVSGRGVGMDVVKTKITQLNGTIDVQSVKGQGTVIAIKVPLTLAIMPTLMVMLGKQTFALPLVSVNEIFHMDLSKTNVVDGQEVVIVREKALPLFHLKRWLVSDFGDGLSSAAHVVVVSVGTQKVGFVVDQLIGQEEVVIKPLGKMLHGTDGMAGATITGDGRIALILDVPSMLRRYAGRI